MITEITGQHMTSKLRDTQNKRLNKGCGLIHPIIDVSTSQITVSVIVTDIVIALDNTELSNHNFLFGPALVDVIACTCCVITVSQERLNVTVPLCPVLFLMIQVILLCCCLTSFLLI